MKWWNVIKDSCAVMSNTGGIEARPLYGKKKKDLEKVIAPIIGAGATAVAGGMSQNLDDEGGVDNRKKDLSIHTMDNDEEEE